MFVGVCIIHHVLIWHAVSVYFIYCPIISSSTSAGINLIQFILSTFVMWYICMMEAYLLSYHKLKANKDPEKVVFN